MPSSAAPSGSPAGCVHRAYAATARSTSAPPNQHLERDIHLSSSCFACTIIDDSREVNAQTGHDRHQNGQFDRCVRSPPYAPLHLCNVSTRIVAEDNWDADAVVGSNRTDYPKQRMPWSEHGILPKLTHCCR